MKSGNAMRIVVIAGDADGHEGVFVKCSARAVVHELVRFVTSFAARLLRQYLLYSIGHTILLCHFRICSHTRYCRARQSPFAPITLQEFLCEHDMLQLYSGMCPVVYGVHCLRLG